MFVSSQTSYMRLALVTWISFVFILDLCIARQSSSLKNHGRVKKKSSKNKNSETKDGQTSSGANSQVLNNVRKGTRLTGVGGRSIRSRSIFLKKSKGTLPSLRRENDPFNDESGKEAGNLQGRLHVKFTKEGQFLLRFHDCDNAKKDDSEGVGTKIICLSAQRVEGDNGMMPLLLAQFVDHPGTSTNKEADGPTNRKKDKKKRSGKTNTDEQFSYLSEEWVPVEGIYGFYMLPSGPHIVLITESELVYQSLSPESLMNTGARPLINLRRIRSMELARIPSNLRSSELDQLKKSEERQRRLLRHSLKEHDFFFVPPTSNYSEGSNDSIVNDITHTLQRSFVHWSEVEKEIKLKEQKEKERLAMEEATAVLVNITKALNESETGNTSEIDSFDIANTTSASEDEKNIAKLDDAERAERRILPWMLSFLVSSKSQEKQELESEINDISSSVIDTNETDLSLSQKNATHLEEGDEALPDSFRSWWSPLFESRTATNEESRVQKPDSRFFWNEESLQPLLQPLIEHENDSSFTPYYLLLDYSIPVASAFVGVQKNIPIAPNTTSSASQSFTYDELLISRRSKFRAGTRFTMRGADASGNVANYAETEQICFVWNKINNSEFDSNRNGSFSEVYSHVQTRGSIPLRWSSPSDIKTYRPKVWIGTDPLAQARALRGHLIEQLQLYSLESYANERHSTKDEENKLVFINLIDKHSDQGRLGKKFSSVLDAVLDIYSGSSDNKNEGSTIPHSEKNESTLGAILKRKYVSHIWFDFHAECKNGRWDRLGNLLSEVSSLLDSQRYFCAVPCKSNDISSSPWSILQLQNGVVRTNCMDCLDRTNVVQSMFGRYILFQQFRERLGLRLEGTRKLPLEYISGFRRQSRMKLPWHDGEVAHRLIWADNADSISRLYAGTNALKGDFTRTGKRTKRGALDDGVNSLQRFYLNNFIDGNRQEGMDLLVGFSKFDTSSEPTANEDEKRWDTSDTDNGLKNKKLDLNWLPGDLQIQLRSIVRSPVISDLPPPDFMSESLDNSMAADIEEIDRRSSEESPWWVNPNEELKDKKKGSSKNKKRNTSKQITLATTQGSSGGYVLSSLVAAVKAPVTTIIAVLCFMLPGYIL